MTDTPAHTNSTHTEQLLHERNKHMPPVSRLLDDDERNRLLVQQALHLTLDATRLALDAPTHNLLLQLAAQRDLGAAIQALYRGEPVNRSENRPALHMALRAADPGVFLPSQDAAAVRAARDEMMTWARDFGAGYCPRQPEQAVHDIIHIGIGGSDLGARMLADALPNPQCRPRLHFISAPDPHLWQRIVARAKPETSAVIITTKSFRTVETLALAQAARDWMGAANAQRFYAVTSAVEAAAMDFPRDHILPLWEWVGGRFSLWSGAGVMGAIAIGANAYQALLTGAAEMDEHFHHQPLDHNLPLLLALYDYWHHSVQGYPVRGLYVYDQRLRLVPDWLRQLEMESLGKRVKQDGSPLDHHSAAMLVGGSGPDAQHAIFQALHQGTRPWPVELATVAGDDTHHPQLQRLQWASMLAQAEALTHGTRGDTDDPARELPGNCPVLCWSLANLEAETLGAWLAAYEHKVFALACLWQLNPFDQWGVEEGKRIASQLMAAQQPEQLQADATTRRWLKHLNWW